ncbi:F-box only protein 3 [Pseudoliparis swirei]|uniref:F-box only protein 3 n=1 Tax=Pseudoliparis swirei TaxID=2059687 RepID=UPI0024BDD619|nr:F-box only protein 3 [Pseudoliparis swirei]
MAANPELRMDQLPSDTLLHVLSFLSFRDLIRCTHVSRRLNDLCKHNPLWRSLCSKHWLLTELSDCLSACLTACLPVPRLMGSMSLSNHYRSEVLLDVETAAGGFQQRTGMRRCLPLTFCFHTGLSQYLALQPAEGRRAHESFYPCPDQTAQDPSAIDMFITGSSFFEWFTDYVHNVVTGEYSIIRDQIFRYVHEQGCVETTGPLTVSVSTSFLPELSSVHPPHFFFTYRIRIEMSSSASPDAACQLDSRYWKITTSDGNVEEVQGPGVVGEFPIMTPGKVHEYASCTTFSTPTEFMEGHYTFHSLANKEDVFHVAIPRFHMICPPFRERLVRTQKAPPGSASRFDDDGEFCDGDGGDDFGDLRGINMAALEGAWCPRHI